MGLRSVKIKRIQRVVKYSLIALIVAALAITAALVPYRLLLPAVAIPERAEGEMRVHFLDVGQGDCTIVEFPSGDALVVDAGDGAFANDGYVIRYLKGIAPASLTLVATHADADHFGGFTEILRAFDVEKVYLPPVGADTSAYRQFLDAVRREGCAQDTLARYKSLLDGSGAYAVCISPHAAEETDENESAAMLYLAYEGVGVLLASDASAAREKELLEEYALSEHIFDSGALTVRLSEVDILKVGHHGSAGSTSEEWLALLQPETAVISCGAGNAYGHPSGDTLARLFAAGAESYRTDELGTVVACISDGTYTMNTQYAA